MTSSPSGSPGVGHKQRLLLQAERFSRRRYGVVILAAILVFAGGTWLGSRLGLESDILQLIPRGNRQVDTFREALRQFGSIDFLVVLLEAGPGEGADEIEDFADELAERLGRRDDLVDFVEYRFQPDADFLELFYENALLFLPPEDLTSVAESLTDDAIRRRIREGRLALASPAVAMAGDLLVHDPLGLSQLLLARLMRGRGALQVDLSDAYYLSREKPGEPRALLMLVKPTGPSQDLAFARTLVETVREEVRGTRVDLEEPEVDEDGGGGVRVRYTGNYAIALDETGLVRRTIAWNAIISFLAVTGLYWLCYRRFAALLYSSVPLLIGQAMTFAAAWFLLGSLNSASAALPALLMGLGTDFTIIMYSRYVEERQSGAGLAEATEAMVGETGLGVFTGAITSAGTFYAICISSFRGLFELGLLIGTGILLCAFAIVFLMPAMITWNEGVRPRKVDALKKLHLQSFRVEHLIPIAARHRKSTVVLVLAAAAFGGYLAWGLEFDDTMASLRSNRSESFRVQQEISERFGASFSYMMAIAEGGDLEEAMDRTRNVHRRLQPFLEDGTVGDYESILKYLPPPSVQQEVIDTLDAGADGPFDAERVRATLEAALVENGFRVEPFEAYLEGMGKILAPRRPLALQDLENRGLSRLVDRYVHRDENGVRIVTYLYPTDPRWKRRPPPGFAEALAADDPGVVVTGTNVVGVELRRLLARDAVKSVGLGLAVVFVLLFVDFRSLRLTAIAMLQLICGVLIMLGAMRLLQMQLNYANAFVATMIMGVGIDYSIHLVHRFHLSGGRIEEGLLETGKGVVMAALTNVAGFGTLTLGNYPAMRSFGLVALLGSLACLFTALTLVPALMGRRGGAVREV